MERRLWSPLEDQILKNLYEKIKISKWSQIAHDMEQEFGLAPRTGKQCRQRYNNHLNPSFAKDQWTPAEEQHLIQLHNQLGNKWGIIAARLGGRQICLQSNHFFAKLRKSLRRMNKVVQERFKKKLKELKPNVLYKIVEASEERFKKNPLCSEQTSKKSCALKNKILKFEFNESQDIATQIFLELIGEINEFNRTYKRRPKQLRRLHWQGKVGGALEHGQNGGDSEGDQNVFGEDDSQDEIVRPDQMLRPLLDQIKAGQAEVKMSLRSKSSKGIEGQLKPQSQAQKVLDSLMVEEEEHFLMPPLLPMLVKRGTSSEFIVDSSRGDDEYFEESGIHSKLPPLSFTPFVKKVSYEQQLFRLCHD